MQETKVTTVECNSYWKSKLFLFIYLSTEINAGSVEDLNTSYELEQVSNNVKSEQETSTTPQTIHDIPLAPSEPGYVCTNFQCKAMWLWGWLWVQY